MSFEWKKFSECRSFGTTLPESEPCNTDRAILIAEGERLQAVIEGLKARVLLDAEAHDSECERLEVENARLQFNVAHYQRARDAWRGHSSQLEAANARLRVENDGLNERVMRLENAIRWLHKEYEHYCLGELCGGLIGEVKP